MNDPLKEMFDGINRLYTEQRELAAIWLEKPIITGSGLTARISSGELVSVNADGRLVDATEQAPVTHKIIAVFGTLVNQFELTLIDLKTNEPSQIKI